MKSIESIRCFLSVAKHLSFTQAAEELDLSVASVSRYVKLLEEELNTALFLRTTRKISLTETGYYVAKQGQQAFDILKNIESNIEAIQNDICGTVSIVSPLVYAAFYIAPLLPSISQCYPDLKIILCNSHNANPSCSNPNDGHYDLYIHFEKNKDSSLISRPLKNVTFTLCGSPEYFKRYPIPTKINMLHHHRLISFHHKPPLVHLFFQHKKTSQVMIFDRSSCWLSTDMTPSLLNIALSGGGLSLLPQQLVQPYIDNHQLIPVLTQYEVSMHSHPQRTYMTYTRVKSRNKSVRVVIDHLLQKLSIYPHPNQY